MPDPSPRVPFENDDPIDPTLVTGHAGVPRVIELCRQLGVAAPLDAQVPVKQRQRGLLPSQLGERRIALWTSGGDRCQDRTTLREDRALATLLGYSLPAAPTVRDFREAFHVEGGPRWPAGPQAAIPVESVALAGLGQAVRTLVAGVQQAAPESTATGDVDATLVASHQDAATIAYDGTRGYPPVVVRWAEQVREGPVPAGCGNVRVLEQAVATLPQGITQRALRTDSALYETAVLRWCADRQLGSAISAALSEQLKAERLRLPARAWQVERADAEAIRAWAEVPYVPSDGDFRKDRPCGRRYLAVRIQKRQGALFAAGSSVHDCAVVTNRPGDGLALLQWHRQKAGTIAHTPHVLKNELAAAALPRGKFGATAAWFRLNALTDTLRSALQRLPLPGDRRTAPPKRLRCLRFNTVGKVVAHARRTLLRLSGGLQHTRWVRVRSHIAALAPA